MTIHVNIGEAKTRLSELIAAAVRGETVVLDKAGEPQVQLVPVEQARARSQEEIGARRRSAFGMFREQARGYDQSLKALKADRGSPEDRFQRKFGPAA